MIARLRWFAVLFLSVFALIIASNTLAVKPPPPDYYPMPVGAEWQYQGINEQSLKQLTVKVTASEKQADGTIWLKTEHDSGFSPFYIWYSKPQGLVVEHRQLYTFGGNDTEYQPVPPKPILKNPPPVGDSWEWSGKINGPVSVDAKEKYEVVAVEDTEVPAGKFSTMKIEVDGEKSGSSFKNTYWYANLVGPIKWTIEVEGQPLKGSELVTYQFPKN
jgi:hypothetical protein